MATRSVTLPIVLRRLRVSVLEGNVVRASFGFGSSRPRDVALHLELLERSTAPRSFPLETGQGLELAMPVAETHQGAAVRQLQDTGSHAAVANSGASGD